jgi:hypothetical protein
MVSAWKFWPQSIGEPSDFLRKKLVGSAGEACFRATRPDVVRLSGGGVLGQVGGVERGRRFCFEYSDPFCSQQNEVEQYEKQKYG